MINKMLELFSNAENADTGTTHDLSSVLHFIHGKVKKKIKKKLIFILIRNLLRKDFFSCIGRTLT